MFKWVALVFLMTALGVSHADAPDPVLSNERLVLHTNVGDIVLGFFPQVAPHHVAQILRMSKAGVYDGMRFVRMQKGFFVQIENYDTRPIPLTPEQSATVEKIPAEFSSIKHQRGLLSMARYDDPNSAEASFSIILGDAPHLDGQYTVFGQVVDGMAIVEAIEGLPLDGESPMSEVTVQSAEVVDANQLTKMHLRGVQPIAVPGEREKTVFEIFAALMFFVTIVTPIVKGLVTKGPSLAKTSSAN